MAKKESTKNPRAEKHDPKVKFEGTLKDMINITIRPIHNKNKATQSDKNDKQ